MNLETQLCFLSDLDGHCGVFKHAMETMGISSCSCGSLLLLHTSGSFGIRYTDTLFFRIPKFYAKVHQFLSEL